MDWDCELLGHIWALGEQGCLGCGIRWDDLNELVVEHHLDGSVTVRSVARVSVEGQT